MNILIAIIVVFFLLVINEWWWRSRKNIDELSRKFIHITVGCFVAFWPYFLSWNQIRFLSVAFLVVVGLSKYFNIFKAIHAMTRPTWGEVCFALAVGLVTFITTSKEIYATSLLQMALADGVAAVAGIRYGKPYEYAVFEHTKSLVGTGGFLLVSYLILLSFSVFSVSIGIGWCLLIAVVATTFENVSVKGLDNLTVPLAVAFMLRLIA